MNIEKWQSKEDKLLTQLAIEIQKVEVQPGDNLVISPKHGYLWTAQFIEWLKSNLEKMLPPCRILVVGEPINIDIQKEC